VTVIVWNCVWCCSLCVWCETGWLGCVCCSGKQRAHSSSSVTCVVAHSTSRVATCSNWPWLWQVTAWLAAAAVTAGCHVHVRVLCMLRVWVQRAPLLVLLCPI
jgi:hypothetical protein